MDGENCVRASCHVGPGSSSAGVTREHMLSESGYTPVKISSVSV